MTLAIPLRRYAPLWPLINWGLFAIGLAVIVAILAGAGGRETGIDARNYWAVLPDPYDSTHFRYSPAFLWVTAPLRLLPWEAFEWVWAGLHVAAVAWLAPWMLAIPFVIDDVVNGNAVTFLALALALSVRYPSFWAVPLLTKVTPGVGLLVHWHEPRALAIAIGSTAAIVLGGLLIAPDLWTAWFASLAQAPENYAQGVWWPPLPVRVVIGGALCVLAARWIWLLPLGMAVAMPGLWPYNFTLLAALPRLLRSRSSTGGGST